MFAWSDFEDLLDRNQLFSGLCAVDSHMRKADVAIDGTATGGEPEEAKSAW
jgi:hypothetical protein